MNKLRSGQLFAMLFLSAVFGLLCQTSAWTIEGICGGGLSVVLQLILCLPMLHLYARGFSFSAYAKQHKFLPFLFVSYLLIRVGVSFVKIQGTTTELSLPFRGKFWATALIAFVCVYTASLGIKAIARSSTVIFGILLFTLAVLLLGAIPQAEPQNLYLSDTDNIWQSFLRGMQNADEVVLLFLLLDFIKQKRSKAVLELFVGKFLMLAFLTLLGMAVLGSRMLQATYPFFSITAISQPFSTQRADALYLLVFVMLCVLRITLYTVLATHLLQVMFPRLRFTSTICLLLSLGISWFAGTFSISDIWNIMAVIIFAAVFPLVFLWKKMRSEGVVTS